MAVMLARYLHFYPGYTAESALQMPWRRFLALYGAIKAVQADDDLRALESRAVAAHPGEKGGQYRALVARLHDAMGRGAGSGKDAPSTLAPGVTPLAVFEAEEGSIEAERARQKAAAERLQAERERRREGQTQGGGA